MMQKVPRARFEPGDTVDLTLAVGSQGEQITTRRLSVSATHRNQYSGKPEYRLDDHSSNRIDYTRWFEEACLDAHDAAVPDRRCKRLAKNGRPCPSTPLYPSGLCIKHKAKHDWDRERQRRKLEKELEKRRPLQKPQPGSTLDSIGTAISSALPQYQSLASPAHLENTADTAAVMWGDVELFSLAANGPRDRQVTVQHAPSQPLRTCFILIALCFATVTLSLSIALWWSFYANDVSGGFTMAGYIVALGGIIMFPIQSAHSKSCTCWRRPASV